MPERLHPGVYVEEVPSGVRPIEGVGTSTAGFIGVTEKGPVGEATFVTSWTQFKTKFGSFMANSYLSYAVLQFFNNGGRKCYIVRVAKKTAETAKVDIPDSDGPTTLVVSASSPGAWANDIDIVIEDASSEYPDEFKLKVVIDSEIKEAFDNLSIDSSKSNYFVNEINEASNYITVTDDSTSTKRPANTKVDILDSGEKTTLVVSASSSEEWVSGINFVKVVIQDATSADEFKLVVKINNVAKETFDNLSLDSSKNNYFVNKINKVSKYITVTDSSASSKRPATITKIIPNPCLGSTVSGDDGDTPGDADYQGDASAKTGFHALDDKNDVNIITVPGIPSNAVIGKGFSYCSKRKYCFFVADVPSPKDKLTPILSPTEAKDFVRNTLKTKNSYGAIYYPWIKATDPIGKGKNPTIDLPPSGFVAGMYARIDGTRGVWKAPAGTEAGIAGALGLTYNATDTEQDILNPFGINCLRSFPASGIVIWGARTLSPDAEWRYIPVRRYAIFLEQSIYYGTQWAVFEPNDEDLWASLRMNIRAFMMIQFREGALQGSTPSEAFYVKCDADLNPQSEIDAGRVNMEIGFAPLKPAEFVIIKITQKAGQQQ